MAESMLPVVLVLLAFWIWQNALRARERARDLARELCTRGGMQLLDQSVSLRRLRLRRVPGIGLRLLRCYGFEVSTAGHDRARGSVDMLDGEALSWDLPASEDASAAGSGNVIDMPPRRTLH